MDPQQQFCLKWNSFGTNLASAFSNLFKSETLADVTLFCEGVTFRAHKLILAACSKHLADLFETAPLHQNLIVILDGTSAANMSALLEFMYKGEVHVTQDCLSSFLKAAECLQVKGLSIEHEARLAAEVEVKGRKEEVPREISQQHPASSPSTTYPQSPVMSPYMHQYHRLYDRHQPTAVSPYDNSRKRHLPPSPPDAASATTALNERTASENLMRTSVLRDGSKTARSSSPHQHMNYHNEGERYQEPDASVGSASTTFDKPDDGGRDENRNDQQNAEDLRVKMEPVDRVKQEQMAQEEQPLSSTTVSTGSGGGNNVSIAASNGSAMPNQLGTTYKHDPDKLGPDIISAGMWNSVQGKLGKAGQVTTPDGKKLKCPFCERLYGYETNLRAHIRQRHQGIRVPCPFCSRTFTRNNTVRRHIAREHKAELSLKAFQETQLQNQSHHSTQHLHQNHAQ